ncbi:MAG: DUF4340 domain-containing protein [Ruminococcus sp.]|uniref:DUF4340 domain-containing protein n=1 Tax=Ruminococcus sp. TaxID=41978 RepID=UPI0025D1FF54|nr:DUF4340 domain-containing protein [Ruminococcus sp.]MBR5684459.1 DUF4340 domain-containing protein [Ruminococcus sp.]
MNKRIIALIVLILMAGASIGTMLFFKDKKNKEDNKIQEEINDNVLFDFDPYSPTQIVFTKGDESYTCKLDGEKWILESGEFPVDQTYCQLICTYCSNLTAVENYGEITDEKLKMYGLDNADKVEITEPKGTHTITIGNMSPTGEYYYATVDGKKNVYALELMRGSVLKLDRLLIKNKELLPYTLYDLKEVTTYKDGKILCDLTFDEDGSKWELPAYYSQVTLDQTEVTATFNNIVRLEAEEMMDEKLDDLTKYGFDKPYGEAVVKGLDGSERHLLVSINESDPKYCYVLVDKEQVEMYYTADLDFTQKTAYDYIVQNYNTASYYNISGFSFKFRENDDKCTLDNDAKECTYNGKSVDIDSSETYLAFTNFYNSFSILKLKGTDAEAKPELKDPELSAEFLLKEGGSIKIDLVKGEDTIYYVFRDGKYIGAYVDESMLTGRNTVSDFYLKFKKLANI